MSKVVLYITAETPFGKGEVFTLHELVALKKRGIDLLIVPRNPSKEIFHKEAEYVKDNCLSLPFLNLEMVINTMKFLFKSPIEFISIAKNVIKQSHTNFIDILKSFAVIPKSLYVSKLLKEKGDNVCHVHANMTTTVSIMAYIIARELGVPWSCTLHAATNVKKKYLRMFKAKLQSAEFIRCISDGIRIKLLALLGQEYREKLKVLHVGVDCKSFDIIDINKKSKSINEKFIIVTPAALLPRKGHMYLIKACSLLLKRGIQNFYCYFYGEGPLRNKLKELIERENLENFIELPGSISNDKLFHLYINGKVDVVILPSIVTADQNFEGIPTALMEAMACGVPVISTNTGDIQELIGDGSGIMVKEKDPEALANAIELLMRDAEFRKDLAEKGRQKVLKNFNLESITKQLAILFGIYKNI
jgi:colanic acid/amylovoran biosynthesis glycosyltransferase